ncbi:hypothetical protein PsYK624_122730 [Phanerochaete sordida]|uniref:Uncharacterized protein n=1 Tax=Phanerochaete sordida TaxID=48140 RepID=A0A9P3GJ48_9APHY|nr:hypothetical protein PsYK624_122730 [Phanerochaete sordida]
MTLVASGFASDCHHRCQLHSSPPLDSATSTALLVPPANAYQKSVSPSARTGLAETWTPTEPTVISS